jgi:hypothetical protein
MAHDTSPPSIRIADPTRPAPSRPPMDDAPPAVRSRILCIRTTPHEASAIEEASRQRGLSISEFARQSMLDEAPVMPSGLVLP